MTTDEAIRFIAAVTHMANRAYCLGIGDDSQPTWDEAPDWQRESAIEGVKGALRGNTPEQSHESWLAQKAADGWTYGPVKDPEAREHPCFVPYAELSKEQRRKDDVFVHTALQMSRLLFEEGVARYSDGRLIGW